MGEPTATPSPRSPAWFPAGVLLAVVAILFVRSPRLFIDLRFFADEATYFVLAYQRGFGETLFAPLLGYYSLLPNLGAALGAHALPLELAPLPNVVLGVACLLTPAWMLMLPGSPCQGRRLQLLAVLLLLVMPPSQGRIDVVYGQYYLAIAAAVILVSRPPTRATRGLELGVLAVSGLTGALAAALAPLFWLAALRERLRWRALQAALLSVCCGLQLAGVLLGGSGQGDSPAFARRAPIEADVAVAAVPVNSFVLPLAGRRAAAATGAAITRVLVEPQDTLLHAGVVVVSGAALVALLFLVAGAGPRPQRGLPVGWLLAASYVVLIALPFTFGVTIGGSRLAYLTEQQRYFAAPNGVWGLALVLASTRSDRRALACRVLVAWMACIGAFTFVFQPTPGLLHGAGWRQEVARWRQDPTRPLSVWPFWWTKISLPAPAPDREPSRAGAG